jgi:hypothetical protein
MKKFLFTRFKKNNVDKNLSSSVGNDPNNGYIDSCKSSITGLRLGLGVTGSR